MVNGGSLYKRSSGLVVPLTRSYDEALRLISSFGGLLELGTTLTPVVLVDDLTRVGQTVAQATQAAAPPLVPVGPSAVGGGSTAALLGTVASPSPSLFSWRAAGSFTVAAGNHNILMTLPKPMQLLDFRIQFTTGAGAQAPAGGSVALVGYLANPSAAELANGPVQDGNANAWILGANRIQQTVAATAYYGRISLAKPNPRNDAAPNTYYDDNMSGPQGTPVGVPWFLQQIPPGMLFNAVALTVQNGYAANIVINNLEAMFSG